MKSKIEVRITLLPKKEVSDYLSVCVLNLLP